jgi:ABC-type branched-subunit amino acid transport system ATPase component
LLGGLLAFYFTWRFPFLFFALPTLVFVVLALRLREPARGVQDRLALGASEDQAAVEETPPTFAEATRTVYAVKTLRRVFVGLPFFAVGIFGMATLLSLYYQDAYRVNEAERGLIFAFAEICAVIGLVLGTPITQRLLNRDPGRVVMWLGLSGCVAAAAIVVVALAPVFAIAVAGHYFFWGIFALVLPGVYSVLSLAIPARARSLGFTYGTLWLLPGIAFIPFLGVIGDAYGLRVAIAVVAPFFLVGSMIIASAGKFLAGDIHSTRVSSMAEHEVRQALAEGEPKLLLMRGLDVAYDQVQVLFGVDFDLKPGEIVALLGTNGAGKSTLLRAISGQVDPSGGAIYFDGLDITHVDPVGTFKLGIVQMPGGRSIFPTLTVKEHLELAAWQLADNSEAAERAIAEVLDVLPRLRERWDQPAGNLSGGEQQMLGLTMSLIAKPKLLMIDELSLGLAPTVVAQLLDIVRRIHAQGTSVILVEQSVNVALTVADRAYFMEKGEVRFAGPTAELLERGDILRAVFLEGAARPRGAARATRQAPGRDGEVALTVAGLHKRFGGISAVDDVSFTLAPGEILGLIGPNGAGKTTVFDLISGFLEPDAGRIMLDSVEITRWPADRRAWAGLGRSFQDARIFPSLSVRENLAVSLERHLVIRDHFADALRLPDIALQSVDLAFTCDQLIELMNLGAFRDKFVSELSTGSRRIVDLAMAIAHGPSVLILDEPSSGIAQRETEALGPLLQRLQREIDCALLVIEHDMGLVTSICDRMIALDLGAIIAEGTPDHVISDPRVVTSYLGGDVAAIERSGPRSRKRVRR